MPPKGYKLSDETRAKMSAARKGKKRPQLRKDPRDTLTRRSLRPDGDDGCWVWSGALFGTTGYGQITLDGKPRRAHRLAYETFKGPIPEGMHVCHTCDVRACVNPDHLFLGTHKDNMDDMRRKGRENFAKGERVGAAKLTEREVKEIRRLWATGRWKIAQLCKKYGLTHVPMICVVQRKTWKHVKD